MQTRINNIPAVCAAGDKTRNFPLKAGTEYPSPRLSINLFAVKKMGFGASAPSKVAGCVSISLTADFQKLRF